MLVGEDSSLSEERLRALERELREELDSTVGRLSDPGAEVVSPGMLRSAEEVGLAYRALRGAEDADRWDRGELVRWVNLEYALLLALIEHLKVATTLPRVPRPRPPPSRPP